jgi:hypothetical protein
MLLHRLTASPSHNRLTMFSKLAFILIALAGAQALRLQRAAPRMVSGVPQSPKQSLLSNTEKVLKTFQVAGFSLLSAAALSSSKAQVASAATASASVDFQAVRDAIGKLYKADPNKGPTLVRLAW